MTQEIKITIKTDGTTEVRVNGIKGRGCKDATREIELALGAVTEDKATAEMYQTAGENVHQRQG